MENDPRYRIVVKREKLLDELRELSNLRAEEINDTVAARIRDVAYDIARASFALRIAKPPVDQRGKYRSNNRGVTQ